MHKIHHHPKKKINWAIWIPVIVTLIGSFTTITVTYINATAKAQKMNNISRPAWKLQVKEGQVPYAQVRMSVKGFTVTTNN